ncbi:MAG: thiamine-phosphate kinase [Betaproteobacteria bacterium]|nr:thiamine-phosphate kinase [Betaproteobacteria bacterium]
MPSEFDLIARHFTRPCPGATLGVGDDAALLRPAPGMDLAVSTDMLVSGRHFLPDTDPRRLGHKTLAVNLSDLAAMGAIPRWATLALALPQADEAWLAAFSAGFFDLAAHHGVDLVGGDTTRGPLALSVTILGEVESGRALRRDAARAGDELWVSGELGGAALGLMHVQGALHLNAEHARACLARLEAPQPRVALGRALIGLARAAIDVSDGLLADLGHILERSGVGAELALERLPVPAALSPLMAQEAGRACALAGGDDYELCFTAPVSAREALAELEAELGLRLTRIGQITATAGLTVRDGEGRPLPTLRQGYDHFG